MENVSYHKKDNTKDDVNTQETQLANDSFGSSLRAELPDLMMGRNDGLLGDLFVDAPLQAEEHTQSTSGKIGIISVGSAGHSTGACRPCAHVWKAAGCSKGEACPYCHICGEPEFRAYQAMKKIAKKGKKKADLTLPPRFPPGLNVDGLRPLYLDEPLYVNAVSKLPDDDDIPTDEDICFGETIGSRDRAKPWDRAPQKPVTGLSTTASEFAPSWMKRSPPVGPPPPPPWVTMQL